jgi:alpha-L-fucosidase 2
MLQRLLNSTSEQGFNMNSGGTYANLFCGHTPFKIDGSFGGTAGIAEMLLRSHDGYIEISPALRDDWKDESFSGLCVQGGAMVSAKWSNAKPTEMVIIATADNRFKIKSLLLVKP